MNKNKMTYKEFKEFVKTPKGKAFVFFGAYLLFFIFIAVIARVGGTSNINKKYEAGSPMEFNIQSLLNNNFKFTYSIDVDGDVVSYDGCRTMINSLFTMNGVNEYYFNGNNYFSNSNGIWLNVVNPIEFYRFIDTKNIKVLLDNSTYISKTEFQSGNEVYNFMISSATISNLLDGVNLDIEDEPNEIIVSVLENNNINEIEYRLDSYCKANGSCTNGMSIILSFEDIDKVEVINNPLE